MKNTVAVVKDEVKLSYALPVSYSKMPLLNYCYQ